MIFKIHGESEPGEQSEEEQSPEEKEILRMLEGAAEKSEVRLTVLNLDGKGTREEIVVPAYREGDVFYFTTETGQGMPIQLSRIKKVELPPEETAEE